MELGRCCGKILRLRSKRCSQDCPATVSFESKVLNAPRQQKPGQNYLKASKGVGAWRLSTSFLSLAIPSIGNVLLDDQQDIVASIREILASIPKSASDA